MAAQCHVGLRVLSGSTSQGLTRARRDLPGTTVFHLLGRVSSIPEYVVWEEDMLEFIFALDKHMPVMERLGRDLKEHGLLVLGLHFSDWLVRFFLRVSKQEPLSTPRVHRAYLADGPDDFSPQSLVLFFGAVSRDIHVMRQDPVAFCAELARRWKARHPDEDCGEPSSVFPPQLPRCPAAPSSSAMPARMRRRRPTWCVTCKRRAAPSGMTGSVCKPGRTGTIRSKTKSRRGAVCFSPLISRTTEADRESYYHLERNWAASRAERIAHDEEFYIPVVIDDSPLPDDPRAASFSSDPGDPSPRRRDHSGFRRTGSRLATQSHEHAPMSATPATPGSSVTPESPWLGLRSFTEEAQSFFFGRSEELDDLYERILDKPLADPFWTVGPGKEFLAPGRTRPAAAHHGLSAGLHPLRSRNQRTVSGVSAPRPSAGCPRIRWIPATSRHLEHRPHGRDGSAG